MVTSSTPAKRSSQVDDAFKREDQYRRDTQAQLARAEEDLKINEAENARLKRLIQALHDVLTMMDHKVLQPSEGLHFQELPPSQGQKPIGAMSMREGALTLLERHGPMTTRELFHALQKAGKRIGGQSPIDTLRSTLRSSFVRTDGKWIVPHDDDEFTLAEEDTREKR